MPEKEIDKYIFVAMGTSAFLISLAKCLSEQKKLTIKDLIVKLFIGTISGMFFGFIACWLIGENVYAVTGFAGGGAIMGVEGIRHFSELVSRWIEKKLD